MHKRLKKLEGKTNQSEGHVILRSIFGPSPDGPRDLVIFRAAIEGGPTFQRRDFDSDTAFKSAVDAASFQFVGTAVDWDGTETFYSKSAQPTRHLPTDMKEPRKEQYK